MKRGGGCGCGWWLQKHDAWLNGCRRCSYYWNDGENQNSGNQNKWRPGLRWERWAGESAVDLLRGGRTEGVGWLLFWCLLGWIIVTWRNSMPCSFSLQECVLRCVGSTLYTHTRTHTHARSPIKEWYTLIIIYVSYLNNKCFVINY